MENKEYLKIIGARIKSELNDLKRTPESAAEELKINPDKINAIINGNANIEDTYMLIGKMGNFYPIDSTDLYLLKDDCVNGIKIMRADESKNSSRIFNRKDKTGSKTPYYKYRDTAMSKLSPFNAHSFASRNSSKDALIIAVTFGGDARRAQKELYILGKERIEKSTVDYRNHNEAISQLIQQHMKNERMSFSNLEDLLEGKGLSLSTKIEALFDDKYSIPVNDMKIIANALNIELSDLTIPEYKPEEEVVVKHKNESKDYIYPNKFNPIYKINPLVRTSKMPLMKGFDIEALSKRPDMEYPSEILLHSYVYNYGEESAQFNWEIDNKRYIEIIYPGDSMYIQPLIKHMFSNTSEKNAKLLVIGVSGAINLTVQKELSYFPDIRRVAHETKQWFE